MLPKPLLIFDASSFRVLGNYYPDRFPTFWKRFAESIAAGQVRSVKEVYNELERYATNLIWPWAQSNKHLFEPPTDGEGARSLADRDRVQPARRSGGSPLPHDR